MQPHLDARERADKDDSACHQLDLRRHPLDERTVTTVDLNGDLSLTLPEVAEAVLTGFYDIRKVLPLAVHVLAAVDERRSRIDVAAACGLANLHLGQAAGLAVSQNRDLTGRDIAGRCPGTDDCRGRA